MMGNRRAYQLSSLLLLAMGLLWIYLSKSPISNEAPDLASAAQKGFLAPAFASQTLDGEPIQLADLRGKPVILNLWASWCPPCREEMPALQKIHSDYAGQGLVVLGLHMTAQDSQDAAAAFVSEYRLTFPVALDLDGAIGRLYRVQALPTTYFINAEGIIQDIIIGGPVAEAVLRAHAEDLLKGTP